MASIAAASCSRPLDLQKQLDGSAWEGAEVSEWRGSLAACDVIIWAGDALDENYRE